MCRGRRKINNVRCEIPSAVLKGSGNPWLTPFGREPMVGTQRNAEESGDRQQSGKKSELLVKT